MCVGTPDSGHVASHSRRRTVAVDDDAPCVAHPLYRDLSRTSTCRTMPNSPQPRAPRPRGCGLGGGRRSGPISCGVARLQWVDPGAPAERCTTIGTSASPSDLRRPDRGRRKDADSRMSVTTPARTALDLACRNPLDRAVAAIDALANVTEVKMADVELLIQRYTDVGASSERGPPSTSSTRAWSHRARHGCGCC
jgi:hypothetical protein